MNPRKDIVEGTLLGVGHLHSFSLLIDEYCEKFIFLRKNRKSSGVLLLIFFVSKVPFSHNISLFLVLNGNSI